MVPVYVFARVSPKPRAIPTRYTPLLPLVLLVLPAFGLLQTVGLEIPRSAWGLLVNTETIYETPENLQE